MSKSVPDPASSANWQVWQDPHTAHAFTDRRRGGLPGGDEQIDVMLRLLRYVPAAAPVILDLGCGDGILLDAAFGLFPGASGVALDGSAAMLEKARQRSGLAPERTRFVQADFNLPDWRDRLPVKAYDAVISGFAIHHSADERKRGLYGEIFEMLNPGGAFINIEHVASTSPRGEELFEQLYADRMSSYRRSLGEDITAEQAMAEMRARPDKAANRLAPLQIQLQWLYEAGYYEVDCYWKHFELAVLAGFKPA